MTATIKDASEWGWIVVDRETYEKKMRHEAAGPGTPCDPTRPGVWVMGMDADGATCLWTGVQLVD